MYFGILPVLMDEWCEACQPTVGQGSVVYSLECGCHIKVVLLHELLYDVLRQLFLDAVAYKLAAEVCSAAFVAQYVTQ